MFSTYNMYGLFFKRGRTHDSLSPPLATPRVHKRFLFDFRARHPDLYSHFKLNGIDLNLTTSKWFICLFMDVLPVEVCNFISLCFLTETLSTLLTAYTPPETWCIISMLIFRRYQAFAHKSILHESVFAHLSIISSVEQNELHCCISQIFLFKNKEWHWWIERFIFTFYILRWATIVLWQSW